MSTCPCCGQELPPSVGIEPTVEELRRWCEARGHYVGPGDTVGEDVAARILDRSPGTLRNWRGRGGAQLAFTRLGRSGRVKYRLADLAELLEAARFDE